MSFNEQNQNQNQNQPSLVGGHAEYVKGAAEATIGAVTGSEPWKASGEQAKARAVSDMRAAGEARGQGNSTSSGAEGTPATALGRAEELAGRAVGCEGMVRDGEGAKRAE